MSQLLLPLTELPAMLELPGPAAGPFHITVRPPGSKSLTNRAVLLAALARGTSTLLRPLTGAEDSEAMIAALRVLGAEFRAEGESLLVQGVGGVWKSGASTPELNLGNAGTATRFLAAAALLSERGVVIDGNERMRQRPIGELGDALLRLGAGVEYLGARGCPPLRVTPPADLHALPVATFSTTRSSQFISALLLTAPFLPRGLTVRLSGDVTSASYIWMTLGLLSKVGVQVQASEGLGWVRVEPVPGGLQAFVYDVEPDASGATYFWAAAAMVPGATCRVQGLGAGSLQGDAAFPKVLERMGATVSRIGRDVVVTGPERLRGVVADLSDMPDAAMTLGAAACAAEGPTTIRGLRTLRDKETDRIAAMAAELGKAGARVAVNADGDEGSIRIEPPGSAAREGPAPEPFETYKDHRMAMSMALLALVRRGVVIRDPGCVAKTYPGYWREFSGLFAGGSAGT